MASDTVLPAGYTEQHFHDIDSTNAEALRQAGQGAPGRLWIRADRQLAGRGRSGRQWQSPEGNLYASLLLRPTCKLETAVQLAFVAGLAAFDAIAAAGPGLRERVKLKWPNDLLLDMRKLGGVLLESLPNGDTPTVVIGTGLNLAAHPDDTVFPATSLAGIGKNISPRQAFEQLTHATAHWLEKWNEGDGWACVRAEWEARSLPKGSAIRVHSGGAPVSGTIAGIDERGALLLDTGNSAPVAVTAGDVFLL